MAVSKSSLVLLCGLAPLVRGVALHAASTRRGTFRQIPPKIIHQGILWADIDHSASGTFQQTLQNDIDQVDMSGTFQHPPQEMARVSSTSLQAGEDDIDQVDAWLFMASPWGTVSERCMYGPALETVKAGLEEAGAKVQIIDRRDQDNITVGVAAAVSKGRRPLVMAIGGFWDANEGTLDRRFFLRHLHDLGAYVVLYQTEIELGWRIWPSAQAIQADEIWDYSHRNIASYPADVDIPVRYIPPGYAPALEVGVDLHGHNRNERTLAYLGRMKASETEYQKTLGATFRRVGGIGTYAQLKDYLETYPMQLNYHRQTNDAQWPLEVFRIAELLANKACVISAPADMDQDEWSDVVHFAGLNETMDTFNRLSQNVQGCQTACYEAFKKKFAAGPLLRRSGLFDAWQPR